MRFPVLVTIAAVVLFPTAAVAGLFSSGWEDDRGKAESCVISLDRDPELQLINTRLVRRDPALAQLADEGIPNESEAQQVSLLSQRLHPCRQMLLAAVRKHHPWFTSAYEIRFFQIDLVFLQLVKRRITFGNANRLLHEAYLEFSAREDAYFQARSDEQRRAFAESLRSIQPQVGPQPPGLGRMTCRWVRSTLYCDPY